jgi:hypothetical protein
MCSSTVCASQTHEHQRSLITKQNVAASCSRSSGVSVNAPVNACIPASIAGTKSNLLLRRCSRSSGCQSTHESTHEHTSINTSCCQESYSCCCRWTSTLFGSDGCQDRYHLLLRRYSRSSGVQSTHDINTTSYLLLRKVTICCAGVVHVHSAVTAVRIIHLVYTQVFTFTRVSIQRSQRMRSSIACCLDKSRYSS